MRLVIPSRHPFPLSDWVVTTYKLYLNLSIVRSRDWNLKSKKYKKRPQIIKNCHLREKNGKIL